MGSDGICRSKVKPGAEIQIEDAKKNSVLVNSFVNPKKYPIIIDTTKIKSISKEARDYYSIRDRDSKVNAIAIIRSSIIGNMVANFFIGLNKPTVPTKLFDREDEAVKWCLKFKEEAHAIK